MACFDVLKVTFMSSVGSVCCCRGTPSYEGKRSAAYRVESMAEVVRSMSRLCYQYHEYETPENGETRDLNEWEVTKVQCASLSQAFSTPGGGKHRPKTGNVHDSSTLQLLSSVPRNSSTGP